MGLAIPSVRPKPFFSLEDRCPTAYLVARTEGAKRMRNARRGWVMPEDEARTMLRLIEDRVRSSDIEVRHRDVLIRLRVMIEEDLDPADEGCQWPGGHPLTGTAAR